jgi:hypothetical protein
MQIMPMEVLPLFEDADGECHPPERASAISAGHQGLGIHAQAPDGREAFTR